MKTLIRALKLQANKATEESSSCLWKRKITLLKDAI